MQQENGLELAFNSLATFGCRLGTRVRNLEYYDGYRTLPKNHCHRNCFKTAAAVPPPLVAIACPIYCHKVVEYLRANRPVDEKVMNCVFNTLCKNGFAHWDKTKSNKKQWWVNDHFTVGP